MNTEIDGILTLPEREFDNKLKEFCQNLFHKSGKFAELSNLYFLQTIDINGNVTGEAYGINLLTNYGFNRVYNSYDDWSMGGVSIYIGNGTGTPAVDRQTLYSPITSVGSTSTDTSSYNLPMTFDSVNGIITGKRQMYVGYFDYNITGITDPVNITELGLGYTSSSNMITHARVYDINGDLSSITKNPNEKLIITVTVAANMKKDLIETSYTNGLYLLINPSWIIGTDSGLYLNYTNASGGTNNKSFDITNYVAGSIANNIKTITLPLTSFYFEGIHDYVSSLYLFGYLNSGNNNTAGFLALRNEVLSTPETIVADIWTNSYTSSSITRTFGYPYNYNNGAGIIPVQNFDISSSYMYDYKLKSWSIEDEFVNVPTLDYNEMTFLMLCMWMQVTFNSISQYAMVSCNMYTDIPITSFNNTGIVLYATDYYWDNSTWELISDLGNISVGLQQKRYYIRLSTTTNFSGLIPIRSTLTHSITPQKTSYQISTSYSAADIKPLSSDVYDWITISTKILYPIANTSYTISPSSGSVSYNHRWATDDMLIIKNDNNDKTTMDYRIYNVTDPNNTPTYTDLKLIFTSDVTSKTYMYHTFTEEGYLVCQRTNAVNEAVIVDLYTGGTGISQYRLDNVRNCTALPLTKNCVYQTSETGYLKFEVYDMENHIVINTFSLPVGYTFAGICGWREFVYIRVLQSGTYSTYLFNTNTSSLEYIPTMNIQFMNDLISNGGYIVATEECMIPGLFDNYSSYPNYIFKATAPTVPIQLFTTTDNYKVSYPQLKYVNDGKQLILACQVYGSYYDVTKVFDIGYIINNGPSQLMKHDYRQFGRYDYLRIWDNGIVTSTGNVTTWYPIENFVQHRLTGTTTTIQSYNNPKNLSGKTFTIQLSNDLTKWTV